jgi:hypothetical protein
MERSQLGQKLAQGGEGEIFLTADRSLVAKVYHEGKMTPEAEQKLRAMLANPPHDSMRVQGRVSISWAVDLVTVNGIVKGYTMPLLEKAKDEHLSNPAANVSKCRDLIDFYNPSTRRKNFPWFHYGYLIRTARNIAIVTDSLHAKGYAIGDVNESNILVALDTIVTFVDTDSFQVPGQGKNFRCQVGKPEYTPPELQGVSFKEIDRTQAHDLFGLGVLIFQLLMQGQHPFAGKYQGQGETPEIKDRIKAGHFPHGNKQVPYAPIPLAPAFTILPLRLQELFIQCFEAGHNAPERRPTAEQWNQALGEAELELKRCSMNKNHLYSKHLSQCCWCELAHKLDGRDPFPSQGGSQLLKPPITPKPSIFTQLLQLLLQQIQNPRKYWQVLMILGVGSMAIHSAGVNLFSQKQSLTSSSPIFQPRADVVPSDRTHSDSAPSDSENCSPSSSNSNGCKGAVKDMKKAEQAEMELLKQEQDYQSALVEKERRAVADAEQKQQKQQVADKDREQREQQIADKDQERRKVEKQKREREGDLRIERARQAASRANEAAAIEQSRLDAGRQKREKQAALRLEQTIQASIRAKAEAQTKQARLEARRQKRERLAALRLEQSRQAGIRSEQRRQIAQKTLEKTSLPQKHKDQKRLINQDSNSVNSAKPWESKVPIKRDSDDLENVIKGKKP